MHLLILDHHVCLPRLAKEEMARRKAEERAKREEEAQRQVEERRKKEEEEKKAEEERLQKEREEAERLQKQVRGNANLQFYLKLRKTHLRHLLISQHKCARDRKRKRSLDRGRRRSD